MPTTITDIMNDDYTTELTIDVDGLERRATIYKISAWQAGTPVIANSFNYCYEVLLHNEDERSEETLPGNIMFFIVNNKQAFGIKTNQLRDTFIKYGLMDEQGNHIGY